MISMKRAKPKKGENQGVEVPEPVGYYEKYSYGLRITLQSEELEKLGLKASSFKIGEACTISCEGEIISIRESEGMDQKPDRSVEIQIKKLTIENKKGGKYSEYDRADKAGPGEKP